MRELEPGNEIIVTTKKKREVRFVVQRIEEHPKERFPTEKVYGATAKPTLRLITCSGVFNDSTGHYLDNLIVFADLA